MILQDLNQILVKSLTERIDTVDVTQKISNDWEYLRNTSPEQIMSDLLHQVINFGLKVLAALAIYFIGIWVAKRIKIFLAEAMKKRDTEKSVQTFVLSMVSALLTILVVIFSISALGVNTTAFAAILAAMGMAIGMAMSGAISNLAGGVLILLFKPFKIGDNIVANGHEGIVKYISIFNTMIQTHDNVAIYIPNGILSNGSIVNYFRNETRRINIDVGVEYGTDFGHMKEVCMGIINADSRVLSAKDEAAAKDPSVNIKTLADSAVIFNIRCWVKAEDYWDVYHYLQNTIYSELPKNGIGFPFPQVDVHIKDNN